MGNIGVANLVAAATNTQRAGVNDALETLPARFEGLNPELAVRLVGTLRSYGATADFEHQADKRSGEGEDRDAASPATKIRELGELRDQGLVTEAEFQAKKAELLDLI